MACARIQHLLSAVSPRFPTVGAVLMLGLGLVAFGGAGCHSAPPAASGRFAAVEIDGNTPGQIAAVTQDVFQAEGYSPGKVGLRDLVFERKGTSMDQFTYGDWAGSVPVWIRVKLSIQPLGETRFLLDCRAYVVYDRGTSVEAEVKLSSLHSHTYQKILDEIAARFRPRALPAS